MLLRSSPLLALLLLLPSVDAAGASTGPQNLQAQHGRSILQSACDMECQQLQRNALEQLYAAWHGASWRRSGNWLSNTSVCSWEGILCCNAQASASSADPSAAAGSDCTSGSVVGISLASNNLTGSFAAAPVYLFADTLTHLDLDANQLAGSLPSYISQMMQVEYLNLGHNSLTGPLTASIFTLPRVAHLLLAGNRFAGTIVDLTDIQPAVTTLDLSSNWLTGTLPRWLLTSRHGRLRSVMLSGNRLRGPLPYINASEVEGSDLSHINLASNQLSGTLPPYLARLPLTVLDLSFNSFSGPIGPVLSSSLSLVVLQLHNNQLNGTIPNQLSNRQMEMVELSYNLFTGTVPSAIGTIHSLHTLAMDHNQLQGTLPDSFNDLEDLANLDVRATSLQCPEPGVLPPFLSFAEGTQLKASANPGGPFCPVVMLKTEPAEVDPFFYQYWGCVCDDKYHPVYTFANKANGSSIGGYAENGPVQDLVCAPNPSDDGPTIPWWGILLAVVGGILLAAVVVGAVLRWALPWMNKYRRSLLKRMPPGFTRSGKGAIVTLVLTDCEGSTELWEWDTDLMTAAIDIHDHTLRSNMTKWWGYEVQTEGDAFLMAFHEPLDAVGWCITTQLALLNADWSKELFRHTKACIETVDSMQREPPGSLVPTVRPGTAQGMRDSLHSSKAATPFRMSGSGNDEADPAVARQLKFAQGVKHHDGTVPDAPDLVDWAKYTRLGVLFRGLRVRMGVATGSTDPITSHVVTHRTEYTGEVYRRAQAVADLPHGGQILVDAHTFKDIHNNLNVLGARVMQVMLWRKMKAPPSERINMRASLEMRRGIKTRMSLELASAPEPNPEHRGSGHGTSADGASLEQEGDSAPLSPLGLHSGAGRRNLPRTHAAGMRRAGRPSESGEGEDLAANAQEQGGATLSTAASWHRSHRNMLGWLRGPSFAPSKRGTTQSLSFTEHAAMESGASPRDRSSLGHNAGGGLNSAAQRSETLALSAAPSGAMQLQLSPSLPQTSPNISQHLPPPHELAMQSLQPSVSELGTRQADIEAGMTMTTHDSLLILVGNEAQPRLSSSSQANVTLAQTQGPLRQRTANSTPRAAGLPASSAAAQAHRQLTHQTSDADSGVSAAGLAPYASMRMPKHLREVPDDAMVQSPVTAVTVALDHAARDSMRRRASIGTAIAAVDMGVFELKMGSVLEYTNVMQVLVPGLEERARLLPRLDGVMQLTPGYLEAPGAMVAPLGRQVTGVRAQPLPLVTLVFCAMERYSEMLAVSKELASDVLALYNDALRRSLLAVCGYECQEQQGNYMIAFDRPLDALEWCLMLQEIMMEVEWTPAMLGLPGVHETIDPISGAVLFRGPRVKAGLYQGVPSKIVPHSTTGRADYFGPLVNRAARYCHAAAQGGQVIASRSLVDSVVRELVKDTFMPPDSLPDSQLPLMLAAPIDNSGVVPSPWCMPQDRQQQQQNGTALQGSVHMQQPVESRYGNTPASPPRQDWQPSATLSALPQGPRLSAEEQPTEHQSRSVERVRPGTTGGIDESSGFAVSPGRIRTRPHRASLGTGTAPAKRQTPRRASMDAPSDISLRLPTPRRASLDGVIGGRLSSDPSGQAGPHLPPMEESPSQQHQAALFDSQLEAVAPHQEPHAGPNAWRASGGRASSRVEQHPGLELLPKPCTSAASTVCEIVTAESSAFVLPAEQAAQHSPLPLGGSSPPSSIGPMWRPLMGAGSSLAALETGGMPMHVRGAADSGFAALHTDPGQEMAAARRGHGSDAGQSRQGGTPAEGAAQGVDVGNSRGRAGGGGMQPVEVSPEELLRYDVNLASVPRKMRQQVARSLAQAQAAQASQAVRRSMFGGDSQRTVSSICGFAPGPGVAHPMHVHMGMLNPVSGSSAVVRTDNLATGTVVLVSGAHSRGMAPPSPARHVIMVDPSVPVSREASSSAFKRFLRGRSSAHGRDSAASNGAMALVRSLQYQHQQARVSEEGQDRGSNMLRRQESQDLNAAESQRLPYLNNAAMQLRTGANKWLWARELIVEDLGLYRFKGVAGNHAIVAVSTAATSARKLAPKLKKAKGERVEPGRGTLYKVALQTPEQYEMEHAVCPASEPTRPAGRMTALSMNSPSPVPGSRMPTASSMGLPVPRHSQSGVMAAIKSSLYTVTGMRQQHQ